MSPNNHSKNVFWVADWEIEPAACEISQGATVTKLEPKVMELLVYLASQPGEVFSRVALEDNVWPGTMVSYDALTKTIGKLREAFGDTGKPSRIIQTVPKKGYRLVAPVRFEPPAPSTEPAATIAAPRSFRLPGVAIASMAGLLIVMVLFTLSSRQDNSAQHSAAPPITVVPSDKSAIVVLPFRNLSEDESNDFLADGLTSEIITDLSRLENLWVVAATSVQKFKDIALTSEQAMQTFNIRYMVTGDLIRTGDTLRINVRLMDATQGKVLWATRYDRRVTDLFNIQSEMVSNIVSALSIKLSDEELRRVARPYTANLEAYEFFIQGQKLYLPQMYEDNLTARDAYQRAIELDPGFARAYAGLALTYGADYRNQWPSEVEQPLEKALEIANFALSLDADLPEVYWVLGMINVYLRNTETSIDYLQRAININPNYADAYALLGVAYIWEDNFSIAVQQLRHSLRLDPAGSFLHYRMLGLAHYYLEDYPQALIYLKQAFQRNPTNLETVMFMACTYLNMNLMEEAQWMMSEARTIQPGLVPKQALQSVPFQDEDKRKRILEDLEELIKQEG